MNFMFCRSCRYGLWGIPSGPCPECGRPFSPHDPRSYVQHSHPVLFQVLIGLGCSVLLVVVMAGLFWLVFGLNYGGSRFTALNSLAATGLLVSLVSGVLAAINRSWWGRVPIFLVGILGVWFGLFLGSEKYFRVWQTIPNPPDEAFSDSGPMVFLFAGWVPGVVVMGILFPPCWLVAALIRRRTDGGGGRDHRGAPIASEPETPPTHASGIRRES